MNFEFGLHRIVTRVTSTVNLNAQAAEEFINAQGWLTDLIREEEGGRREEDDEGGIGESIWETLQESASQFEDNEQGRSGTVMEEGERREQEERDIDANLIQQYEGSERDFDALQECNFSGVKRPRAAIHRRKTQNYKRRQRNMQ